MEIIYNNETLLVNIEKKITLKLLQQLEDRLYSILNNYSIINIEINVSNNLNSTKYLFQNFKQKYANKCSGNIIINYN